MKSEFHDQPGRQSPDGPIGAVVAALEAAPRQDAEGLVVDLHVTNGGEGRVEVLNPFEMVQFQLLDAGGFPVSLPFRMPRLMVGHGHDGPGAPPLEPAMPVVGFVRDGQPGDQLELHRRTLVLAPTGQVLVSMVIATRKSTSGGTEPLPDGDYHVGAILTVIDAADPSQSRVLQAAPVDVVLTRR